MAVPRLTAAADCCRSGGRPLVALCTAAAAAADEMRRDTRGSDGKTGRRKGGDGG
jgi:hypothetical protein